MRHFIILFMVIFAGCISRRKAEATINYFPWIECDNTCAIDLVKGYGAVPQDSLISRVGYREGQLGNSNRKDIDIWFVYHGVHLIILTDTTDWRNKVQSYFKSNTW